MMVEIDPEILRGLLVSKNVAEFIKYVCRQVEVEHIYRELHTEGLVKEHEANSNSGN